MDGCMLYSKAHNLIFGHYPKTAGTSMLEWFQRVFPDALVLDQRNYHLDLRAGLRRLHLWNRQRMNPFHHKPRVIGVVREPFEMLVSLYEFWQRCPNHPDPSCEIVNASRNYNFKAFLKLATDGHQVPRYEDFFALSHPGQSTVRLIDFDNLEAGLREALDTLDIDVDISLRRTNCSPSKRTDLSEYVEQAGPLMLDVHRYFAWYYTDGVHLMASGKGSPRLTVSYRPAFRTFARGIARPRAA